MNQETFTIINSEDFQKILLKIESIERILTDCIKSSHLILYTEDDLSKKLQVNKKTLANYRNVGKIGFVKPDGGKKIFYTLKHVQDFLYRYEYEPFV